MKLNISFIINPISGGKSKHDLPERVNGLLDRLRFKSEYWFTEYPGHAAIIAEEVILNGCDVVVAVGGDGTINETATIVKKYGKVLGIVPFGSGNGLARHLGIPMDLTKAIELLNRQVVASIDTGVFNGKNFYNIAGVGFDAHISALFAKDKKRGLIGYVKMGLREMITYKPDKYHLTIDGREFSCEAYAISVANSSQYGNNIYISPRATPTDGLLDVCIVKKFPLYQVPLLLFRAIRAETDKAEMVEIIKGKHILIKRQAGGAVHIDGEPLEMDREISIFVEPLSLQVIVPDEAGV